MKKIYPLIVIVASFLLAYHADHFAPFGNTIMCALLCSYGNGITHTCQ